MPCRVDQAGLVIGVVPLAWDDLASLRAKYLRKNPSTLPLEQEASSRCSTGVDRPTAEWLVPAVCTWGGYAGVYGRVFKSNSLEHICECLTSALKALDADRASTRLALDRVNHINGLGTPSFASKHLRMLRPKHCVVFDDIIRRVSGLPFNSGGYSEFCRACTLAAETINTKGSYSLSERIEGKWLPADIEMAVFERVSDGQYKCAR